MENKQSSTEFACTCGRVSGLISPVGPRTGGHLICHCSDCRATELYLEQPDPAPGGVNLFQTSPDTIQINAGRENLAILRLSPKGPFRWYATCCKATLFNTLTRPGLPFVTVLVDRMKDPALIGPVTAQAFVPQPGAQPKHKNGGRMVWGVLSRMIASRLSGRWKKTPFFDVDQGDPKAQVHLISKEERAGLYN